MRYIKAGCINGNSKLLENMEKLFGGNNSQDDKEKDEQIRKLREKAGSLTMKRDFLEYACKRAGLVKKTKDL